MKLWRRALVLSTALGAMVTGCAGAPAASTSGRLSVTAAFYPFQFVAERVGGDLVTVANLTTAGTEPHDLELSPKQVAGLGEVDLVIYQKGFQPASTLR